MFSLAISNPRPPPLSEPPPSLPEEKREAIRELPASTQCPRHPSEHYLDFFIEFQCFFARCVIDPSESTEHTWNLSVSGTAEIAQKSYFRRTNFYAKKIAANKSLMVSMPLLGQRPHPPPHRPGGLLGTRRCGWRRGRWSSRRGSTWSSSGRSGRCRPPLRPRGGAHTTRGTAWAPRSLCRCCRIVR